MLNLEKGTKLSRELFDKLLLLQDIISSWLREGRLSDTRIDSRSVSHMISAELDFLARLDIALAGGVDGYEVLRRTRDMYATLHRRGHEIQRDFKDIIALPCSKSVVRPLLDALVDLAEVGFIYSSRAQRLNALIVQWCNNDSEQVKTALREVRLCVGVTMKLQIHCLHIL